MSAVAARLDLQCGRKEFGKDHLVTERSDAARPTSNDPPNTSPDQLSVGSASTAP
jgi:hypothetical protein